MEGIKPLLIITVVMDENLSEKISSSLLYVRTFSLLNKTLRPETEKFDFQSEMRRRDRDYIPDV